jgi:hypothetical protein
MVVRRVSAWVEVDGKWREMKFITNNREWSAQTICDLYSKRLINPIAPICVEGHIFGENK